MELVIILVWSNEQYIVVHHVVYHSISFKFLTVLRNNNFTIHCTKEVSQVTDLDDVEPD